MWENYIRKTQKIYCLGEGLPAEEARFLLKESNWNIKFVLSPTSNDETHEQSPEITIQNSFKN